MLRTVQSLPLCRAFDTGLRPGPFPDRAASLLPGLLAATRTGLAPASDDEHEHEDHPVTSRGHLRFCWAHESPGLIAGQGWDGRLAPLSSPFRASARRSARCLRTRQTTRATMTTARTTKAASRPKVFSTFA